MRPSEHISTILIHLDAIFPGMPLREPRSKDSIRCIMGVALFIKRGGEAVSGVYVSALDIRYHWGR